MKVFKWAVRHGVLEVDEYDTLISAVRSAWMAREGGHEALLEIEVVHEPGRIEVFNREQVDALIDPLEKESLRKRKALPVVRWVVDLQGRTGEWAGYGSYEEHPKAQEDADRLGKVLGTDRVRIRPYGRPYGRAPR